MSDTAPIDIGQRIIAALGYVDSVEDVDMRPHLLWQVKAIMTRMRPEDLSDNALVSLVAILGPEHSRFIDGVSPGAKVIPLTLLPQHN